MLPRDLGDGLVLRRATEEDTEVLMAFNMTVHQDLDEPEVGIDIWTRDMMRGDHPTTGAGDFLIVEDTGAGVIASSLCLISQTWTYAGIPFGVGRPEMVGTAPTGRRRGLVRAQFDVIHKWSAARGELAQMIGGIPWYYRQFGYEMALELDSGRFGYRADVPDLAADVAEPFRIRPATEADLPFMARAYQHGMRRGRIACLRDAAQWHYDLAGHSAGSDMRLDLRLIETASGEPVGFFGHPPHLWQAGLYVTVYELAPGVSWLPVTSTILRYLRSVGDDYAAAEATPFTTIHFEVGTEHPVYRVAPSKLRGASRPYAWYVRVPDLAGFLRHIAPALDARLADSILAGHTGELALNFYRTGLRLTFTASRLTGIEPWQPASDERGNASFPDLTFLQLLFGYRSLDALTQSFSDCTVRDDDARVLLDTLFPQQVSHIWPVA
ncbi:MAG: GNAT family N-acetyltransferase [Thermomicrobiales bacterium]